MAFQAGTQVDPRLMQADYSGFTKAAEIQAQGMANLGEQIGAGIKGYKARKDQEKIDQAKVNQAEAFGDATIALLGEESAEADAIANMLALNFGADIPLSQRAASADNFAKLVSGMLDIGQSQGPVTTREIGDGVLGVFENNKLVDTITPSQRDTGASALTAALTGDGGGTPAAPTLMEGEVLMMTPEGKRMAVPQEQVQRAQAAGYTVQ
jgi:hypothetical protein